MPTLGVQLCRATPVDPVELGAHVDAYIKVRPAIHTLRLCCRFGRGQDVVIDRLPFEMLDVVVKHLIEDESEKFLEGWREDYECFECECRPSQHLEREEQVKAYLALRSPKNEAGGICRRGGLSDEQLEDLDEALEDSAGEYDSSWWKDHMKFVRSWQDRTGWPTSSDRGTFTEHENILLSDFGLKIWICLRQDRCKEGDLPLESHAFWTFAYFTLPGYGVFEHPIGMRCRDNDTFRWNWHPTEYACEMSLAIPIRPSRKSLERFPRAFKLLGLEPLPKKRPVLFASSDDSQATKGPVQGDSKGRIQGQQAHGTQVKTGRGSSIPQDVWEDCLAQLQLLIASKDTA